MQNKSTKLTATPANRKEAQQIAVSCEQAHQYRTVVKTLRDNYSKIAQKLNRSWKVPTVKDFIANWTAMSALVVDPDDVPAIVWSHFCFIGVQRCSTRKRRSRRGQCVHCK